MRIDKESEQIVKAGEPLLRIGDPKDLEIVVDLLSTDAVKSTFDPALSSLSRRQFPHSSYAGISTALIWFRL